MYILIFREQISSSQCLKGHMMSADKLRPVLVGEYSISGHHVLSAETVPVGSSSDGIA